MKHNPFTVSRQPGSKVNIVEMNKTFDWTRQTLDLLRQLDGVISDLVGAWDSFTSDDIYYFQDTNESSISPRAHRSLRTIKSTFLQLHAYQRKLFRLNERCSDFSKAVSLFYALSPT